MRSESCPFCRGSLKRVNSGDLWVLTCGKDVVDQETLSEEDVLRFYLYINSLPKDIPDSLFLERINDIFQHFLHLDLSSSDAGNNIENANKGESLIFVKRMGEWRDICQKLRGCGCRKLILRRNLVWILLRALLPYNPYEGFVFRKKIIVDVKMKKTTMVEAGRNKASKRKLEFASKMSNDF
ncbi:RING-type domain-containing protein [Forsythia ovata]|uniref:RING-type domain-containing protein n=1 Tax=Forsythia ovata TaxID=205694 RepID=A0ABD1TRM2_9LAMI